MKQKINKMAAVFVIAIFALSGIGIAYAAWTDTITIYGDVTTGVLEWEFNGPFSNGDLGLDLNCFFDLYDGEWVTMDKNVASTNIELINSHTLRITIDNAYPYYGNHIAFKVHGLGTIPLKIWKVNVIVDDIIIATWYDEDQYIYLDLDGETGDDLEIWWGNGFGEQLHHCDKHDVSFELLILQPAPQSSTLTFDIELVAIQWNEYVAGPLQ